MMVDVRQIGSVVLSYFSALRQVYGHMRRLGTIAVPCLALFGLGACASDFTIYEAPTTGPVSKLTFVNASKEQTATLMTFVDGRTCTGRRHIRFNNEYVLPYGGSHLLNVPAGEEFALYAVLNTVEIEELSVELGVTGSGPAPVISRKLSSIGCKAGLSFPIQIEKDYEVVISERESSGLCSVVVSEVRAGGVFASVETRRRNIRNSADKNDSFCEPLAK